MPTIQEREIRAKELAALAAVVEATIKAADSAQISNLTREGFVDTTKSAQSLIDDILKDMYTHG
jgi:type IV secretory pathway VirD2 relaxase